MDVNPRRVRIHDKGQQERVFDQCVSLSSNRRCFGFRTIVLNCLLHTCVGQYIMIIINDCSEQIALGRKEEPSLQSGSKLKSQKLRNTGVGAEEEGTCILLLIVEINVWIEWEIDE